MIHMEYQQKMRRCHEYAEALEEEKRKIQVFQRELPLCLELVSQAIEACRTELSGSPIAEHTAAQPEECSEQTTSGGPVFEEFIPTKRSDSFDDGDDEEESTEHKTSDSKKKSDWLRSVQLWNNHESPDPADDEDSGKNGYATEVKRNGGAFHPFQKDRAGDKSNQSTAPGKATASVLASVPASATSSSAEAESKGGEKKEEKEGQTPRKHRRCWSPELHRRFLHALQQLGGSHVATPKQIRELMKVDGLTNDEVKSHLQKYRLHTRRPSVAIHNNGNPQVPQFVVVGGGIWVPPPAEYATMTATTGSGDAGSPATVYAPVATLAQPCKPMVQRPKPTRSNDRGSGMSHSTDGAARSSSPAGSSSTRTTTASPCL